MNILYFIVICVLFEESITDIEFLQTKKKDRIPHFEGFYSDPNIRREEYVKVDLRTTTKKIFEQIFQIKIQNYQAEENEEALTTRNVMKTQKKIKVFGK